MTSFYHSKISLTSNNNHVGRNGIVYKVHLVQQEGIQYSIRLVEQHNKIIEATHRLEINFRKCAKTQRQVAGL